jgi:hypothetical protein
LKDNAVFARHWKSQAIRSTQVERPVLIVHEVAHTPARGISEVSRELHLSGLALVPVVYRKQIEFLVAAVEGTY